MFSNLNWWNIIVLLLLALFIFGDKLPQVISDGFRMLRNLRRMARTATADLNRELGTDLELEDLHPKTFIRKHVLSEADQEALVKPLRGLSEELVRDARGVEREFTDLTRSGDRPATRWSGASNGSSSVRAGASGAGRTSAGATGDDSGRRGAEAGTPDGTGPAVAPAAPGDAVPPPRRRSYDDIS